MVDFAPTLIRECNLDVLETIDVPAREERRQILPADIVRGPLANSLKKLIGAAPLLARGEGKERPYGFVWPKCLRNIAGSFGQAGKHRLVHVQTLFSLDFPDWLRLRK
jgi:hypothetical protein